jgi:hypothetical protein
MVAMVPLASYINDLCDQTCIILTHEHDFIRHKSYVLYRKARTMDCAAITRGLAGGELVQHKDMNPQTFLRIILGLCRSEQTPRKIKLYLNCP